MTGKPKMRPRTDSKDDHSNLVKRLHGLEFRLEQLRQREYCDIKLRAVSVTSGPDALLGSEPLYGHRIILESASPFLKDIFASGVPNPDHYTIPGIKRCTLDFLLNCIYNCEVGPIDEDNMYQICAGAKLLQLSDIQSVCEEVIESTRNIDTCLKIWSFGRKEACTKLCDSSFILENFAAVSKTTYFTTLTVEEVEGLISSQKGVTLSDEVLLSLYDWVKAKTDDEETDNRIRAFISIIRQYTSLDDLDHKLFATIFINDIQLKDHNECRKFREEYLTEFLLRHIKGEKLNGPRSTPRHSVTTTEENNSFEEMKVENKVLRINETSIKTTKRRAMLEYQNGTGEDESAETKMKKSVGRPKKSVKYMGPLSSANIDDDSTCIAYYVAKDGQNWGVYSYDLKAGISNRVVKFPNYRPNGVLVVANNSIYYIGGQVSDEDENDSDKIDLLNLSPKEKKWQSSPLLKLDEGRSFFHCAILDDQIYIVAGYRDSTCIDSVERIPIGPARPAVEGEEEVTNVKWPKNRSPVAVLDGKLYSVGGTVAEVGDLVEASSLVERYDPKTNIWSSDVERMPSARVGHALVVLDSKLYALGGAKTEDAAPNFRLAAVECYNAQTNSWTTLTSMIKKRQYASAFAFGGLIYIAGGDSLKTPTIEKYDPETNSWELMNSSTLPRDAVYSSMVFQIEREMNEMNE